MSYLEAAQRLQAMGFEVFPLSQNSKLPACEDFEHVASTEFTKSQLFWRCPLLGIEQPYNIGVSTSRFRLDEKLIVVDIDKKKDKDGYRTILQLEMEGKELPNTFSVRSPSGSTHLYYKTKVRVANSAGSIGPGVDIRGGGGYVVGPGSTISGKEYVADFETPLVDAPRWLEELKATERVDVESKLEAQSELRAKRYLLENAPIAVEGEGGNHATYLVAAHLKDLGVDSETALELLLDFWNDRCEPPWVASELSTIVSNAYRYGKNPQGILAAENAFTPIADTQEETIANPHVRHMNKEFGFVLAGGGHHILWETTDARERFTLVHLHEQSFHAKHASRVVQLGTDKNGKPIVDRISKVWMRHPERRSYKGFVFRPGQSCPKDYYNLFRGFAVQPYELTAQATDRDKKSVDDFLDHAFENVCGKDEALFNWLIGYFAHIVQKPYEKPLVALVFRGEKGVGKNALIDRVGHLLGGHYLVTANRRYLVSNFNGHLENCLLFALDEAFWSGDKQAEGVLKDLITGNEHVIEHKGKETYIVENRTRVVIIGNEEWLVPATQDERRFAVFNVGSGRKQDHAFFTQMREGMEQGGYRALLRYLLDFDLSKVNVNQAPLTDALLDQKLSSENPVSKWWLECLESARLVNSPFDGGWPAEVGTDVFRDAYKGYHVAHRITARVPDEKWFGRSVNRMVPGIKRGKMREGESWVRSYLLPSVEECRRDFEKYIGHKMEWAEL